MLVGFTGAGATGKSTVLTDRGIPFTDVGRTSVAERVGLVSKTLFG
jgi:dephospho-CoA kinase